MVESNPTAVANNERLLQVARYDRDTLDLYEDLLGTRLALVVMRVRINQFIEILPTMQVECVVCNNEDRATW